MELSLKQEALEYYERHSERPFSFETVQEAIVPDSCADVQRIVETNGYVLLHRRELLSDGRLEVSGVIRASVLFVPEGEKNASAVQVAFPLHTYCDGKGVEEQPFVTLRLKSLDTRLLNPRKFLIRAETEVSVSRFEKKTLLLTTDATAEMNLEKRYDSGETALISAVYEREVSFSDEMNLSVTRPGAREILAAQTTLTPGECRVVGSRIVIKGIARGEILYKDEQGNICSAQQEFLFSQIVEHEQADEAAVVHCAFDLVGCEYAIGGESERSDGHSIGVTVHARSHISLVERRAITFLADLYSTDCLLSLEHRALPLRERLRYAGKKQALREQIPTASAVKEIVWTRVDCAGVRCECGEDGSCAEVTVRIRCLYLDEEDALQTAEKEIAVKAETELGRRESAGIDIHPAGEISAAPAGEGIDVRFSLEFLISSGRAQTKTTVSAVRCEEEGESAERPSLVLRRFEQGMKLWDVAKAYRTTAASILAANAVESEGELTGERLLLIPKRG